MTSLFQCRVLDELVQRGQDTNFNFGAVLCRFTDFIRDWKYVKNRTKYHRIDPSNIYDGLSTTNFYEKKYKFPMEKILKPDEPPLKDYNLSGENTIDNSLNNNNVSYSQKSRKMLKNNPVPSNTHSEINYQQSNNEINKNQ